MPAGKGADMSELQA